MLGDEIDFSFATIDNIPLGSHDRLSLCTKFKTPTLQPYNDYGNSFVTKWPWCHIMITVQSTACSCPWSSLSPCPTGQPMTATGRSTKAALRTGRQEPRTGGAMRGPLVKYPSEVSCKYLSHSADSSIACFSDESVDSFVFPAWQPDTWTSFCMMADAGNRTFKGRYLQWCRMFIIYSLHYFQATLNGVPLYNTTSYKGGHKKGELVTLFGDEEWIFPARGSITDLHIWSRIITEKGVQFVCFVVFIFHAW